MDKALVGMCVNERSLVKIPPHLAYGKEGYGKIILALLQIYSHFSFLSNSDISDRENQF